jgi:hypothetical protein
MAIFQAFAAPITDSVAHFKAWAQFYGGGFTTIGWVNLAGTGTVNTSGTAVTWVSGTTFKTEWAGSSIIINATNFTIASVNSTTSITLTATAGTQTGVAYTAGFGTILNSGTGAGYTFTNAVSSSSAIATGINAMSAWTYRGIWVSGQTYPNGSNTLGSTADLVTDTLNGVTYVKITSNVATNLTTAPSANATDWQPYQYEIWKSTGSQTTGTNPFPIYCRLAYTSSGTASCIRMHVAIGIGVDINGNLTSSAQITAVNPVTNMQADNAGNNSSTPFEMDFAGDTDNFRFVSFRGATTANYINTFVVDRSRDASGNSTNAFVYCGGIAASNGTGHTGSCILVNPVMGASPQQVSTQGWLGVITACALANPTNIGGSVPPFPVFPMPGYVANPCLGVVGFHNKDVVDGALQSVWMYGASHYYLINGFGGTSAIASLQTLDNVTAGAGVVEAILWE